jgi:hypothetical protein
LRERSFVLVLFIRLPQDPQPMPRKSQSAAAQPKSLGRSSGSVGSIAILVKTIEIAAALDEDREEVSGGASA